MAAFFTHLLSPSDAEQVGRSCWPRCGRWRLADGCRAFRPSRQTHPH